MNKAYLFKIKENKKSLWYSWCQELDTILREDAIETLVEEKVSHELVLGFTIANQDYSVGYMNGECLPANMSKEINIKHKKMKEECLERVSEVEILYDIKATN